MNGIPSSRHIRLVHAIGRGRLVSGVDIVGHLVISIDIAWLTWIAVVLTLGQMKQSKYALMVNNTKHIIVNI